MIRLKILDLPKDTKISRYEMRGISEGIDTVPLAEMPLRFRREISGKAARAEAYWKTAYETHKSLKDLVLRNPLKRRLAKSMTKEIPLVPAEDADLLYVDTAAFAELGIPVGKYGRLDEKMVQEILSVIAVRTAKKGETPTLIAVATRYSDQATKGGIGTVQGDGRAGIIGRPIAAKIKTRDNKTAHRLLNLRLKGFPTGLAPKGVPKGDGHVDGKLPGKSAISNTLQAAYLDRNGIRTNRAIGTAHTHEQYEYSFNLNGRRVPYKDRVGFQLMAGVYDRVAHLNYLSDDPEEMRAFLDDVNYQLCSEIGRKLPLSHAGLFKKLVGRKAREFADMYWTRALHGSTTFDNIGLLESVDQALVVTVDRAHPTYRPVQHISPGFAQEGTRVLDAIACTLADMFWRTATRPERTSLAQIDAERFVKNAFDERMQANALEHLGLDLDSTRSLMKHHKDLTVRFASTVRRVGEEQEVGQIYEMGPGKEQVTDPARYDIFAALSVLAEVAASDLPQQEREQRVIEKLSPLVPDDPRDRKAARALLEATAPLLELGMRGLDPEARQEAVRVIGEEARRANRSVEAFTYSALRGWCEGKLEKLHSGELSRTRFQAEIEALLREHVRRGPQTPRAIGHGVRDGSLPRDSDGRMELARIEENGVCIQELSDGANDMIRVSIATDPLGLTDLSRYRLTLSLWDGKSVELKPTAVAGDEAVFSVPVQEPPKRIRAAFYDAQDPAHRWDQDGLGFGAGHSPILSSMLVDAELAAFAKRTANRRRQTPEARVRAAQRHLPHDVAKKTVHLEALEQTPAAQAVLKRLAVEVSDHGRPVGRIYKLANGGVAHAAFLADGVGAVFVASGDDPKAHKVPGLLYDSYEPLCLDLGLPAREPEAGQNESLRQEFEHGVITWSPTAGNRVEFLDKKRGEGRHP